MSEPLPSPRIVLLRHATAQEPRPDLPDARRELVAKGERQARDVAAWCRRQGLCPGRLLTSPLPRAAQTAALLAGHLGDCPAPEPADWLQIGTPPAVSLARVQDLMHALMRLPGPPEPWLVGHEPDLSGLIAALLHSPRPVLWPKKASLTALDWPDGIGAPARLLWHLPCALMGAA
ncbi:putative phosphohistidine phosphatase, SixA [Leptothrix cholodnii SP-6]|uniref:Putative phosphohistidine phosphatase, SixA n=1 Tax=Leptothrix cholodnii (strain ATCC 51168 / LMG 8142 / SP-6) TaxID=395495 RepID=B1XZG6_LEPCP|nr:histidine phosphatase family protein [Leptothrix cholodnii]ACB36529.1 putative phosphohistidine phosphatase, SixA [Leptothrix cholodnii SP-6]